MNLTLARKFYEPQGIFSILTNDAGQIACTLEHAYPSTGAHPYAPKIPDGTFTCRRGQHQLASMTSPFTTFEVTGVPGHTNILFHIGNYNKDSEGCILMGRAFDVATDPTMILHSKATFGAFMELMKGVDSFTLTVTG